jgi:YggT family protein
VGDQLASFGLLADTRGTIAAFLHVFLYVYIALLFVYVLSTWVQLPYSSALGKVQRFLDDVCGPYLRLFRRVVPPIGALDLSPMVGMFVLILVDRLVVSRI